MAIGKGARRRRQEARRLMSQFSATPWAMEENALAAMLSEVEAVANDGEICGEFYSRGNAEPQAGFWDELEEQTKQELRSRMMAFANVSAADDGDDEYSVRSLLAGGTLFVLVSGTIHSKGNFFTKYFGDTSTADIRSDVLRGAGDSRVSRIVMILDSPGGSVFGLAETARAIYESRSKKTILGVVDGLCASACYFLGSACERLIASESSSIGSIGVIAVAASFVKAYEKVGIDVKAITFGKNKGVGSPFKALDENSVKVLQESVDDYGKQFVDAVARNRGVSFAKVMSDYGQGKCFLAASAVKVGMIDGLASGGGAESMTVRREAAQTETPLAGNTVAENASGVVMGELNTGVTGVAAGSVSAGASISRIDFDSDVTGRQASVVTEDTVSFFGVDVMKITAKIRSALYALGWVDAVDAADEVCLTALNSMAKCSGRAIPETEQAALDLIVGAGGNSQSQSSSSDSNVQTLTSEHDQALAAGRAAERERRGEIIGRASAINAGRDNPVISQAMIDAAVEGEDDLDDISAAWIQSISGRDDNGNQVPGVTPSGDAPVGTYISQPNGAAIENFGATAETMLLDRCGLLRSEDRPSSGFGDVARMSLSMIAAECLRMRGSRSDTRFMTNEQIARDALQMGAQEVSDFYSSHSAAAAYNRPGDFPHLMSNLAGKMLDRAMELADVTYDQWTHRMPDVNDFKAKSILAVGSFTRLDDVADNKGFTELAGSEELRAFIQASRKGNKVGLTPRMIADDDLDGFTEQLKSLAFAHENTLNEMCVNILTGNPTLLDGNPLFDASNHGNLVSGGGAPSAAQATKHRLLHQKQTGVGTDKKTKSRPAIVLVPTDLQEAAMQTYYTLAQMQETKVAQTDATLNTHRGTARVICESDLDDASTAVWYTLADPNLVRAIAIVFMTGYGRGGQRETWYDPNTKNRWLSLEGRFGATASNYRAVVKNPGS